MNTPCAPTTILPSSGQRSGRFAVARRTAALAVGTLMAMAVAANVAMAQDASTRPIRIISAFPAGIGPDVTMRAVADQVTKQTGRQILIDAQPGGNGLIAISALKQAAPDGNTFLLVSNAHLSIIPALMPNAPYKVDADFAPVATIYRAPFFLAVSSDSKYQNLTQLLAAARAGDNKVSYSVAYLGAPQHLGIATMASMTSSRMLVVPYKDGGVLSVVKGETDFSLMALGSARPFVDSGKLRILAVSASKRSELMPDVPTLAEAGGPPLQVETFTGIIAPQGTPARAIQTMNEQIAAALRTPEVIDRFAKTGVTVLSTTPEQMTALMKEDAAMVAEQVKRTGVRAE